MNSIYVLMDNTSDHRGGGRMMSILKENLSDEIKFVTQEKQIPASATVILPPWNPYKPQNYDPSIGRKRIQFLYDLIPIKYPDAFPTGLKATYTYWRNKRFLKKIDACITISDHSKQDIVNILGIPEQKVHVVYPTTSQIFFDRTPKMSYSDLKTRYTLPQKPYCLYVGDHNWNKNLPNLAEAIKIANIPLVIAGKAYSDEKLITIRNVKKIHPEEESLKQFAQTIHHTSLFYFTGFVPDEDLIHLYDQALCNISVSFDEGFGLSYLEASTQSTPSVLSQSEIYLEVAGSTKENPTALFADPSSPRNIADKILKLADDEELAEKIGTNARSQASMYSPKKFAKAFLKAIESVE